jgi:hypothetical protein
MALITSALTLALLATADAYEPGGPALSFSVLPDITVEGFSTRESVYRVFRSADEFLGTWRRSSNCDNSCARSIIASIDFAQNMLVLIAPRGSGQATYDVVVTAVTSSQGSIDVSFLELRHGEPKDGLLCGVILTMPTPTVAFLVSRSDGPVRFFRRRADVICERAFEVQ